MEHLCSVWLLLKCQKVANGIIWTVTQLCEQLARGLERFTWVRAGSLCSFPMWSLQHGVFGANGFFMCKLRTLTLCVPSKAGESCLIFYDLASEITQHTFVIVRGLLRFKGREIVLHFWMQECEQNIVIEAYEMGLRDVTILENTISHSMCKSCG